MENTTASPVRHKSRPISDLDAGTDSPHWRKPAYSLAQFFAMYGIHESTYHRWRHRGCAPEVQALGGRRFITENARAKWHREHFGDG